MGGRIVAPALKGGGAGTFGTSSKGGNGAAPLGAAGGTNSSAPVAGTAPGGGGGAGFFAINGADGADGLIRFTYVGGLANKKVVRCQAVKRASYY